MAKQKEKPYDNIITGYGKTPVEARKDAEKQLPYSIKAEDLKKGSSQYARISIGHEQEIKDNMWKVEIMYDLIEDDKKTQQRKKKSSSYGPTDVFSATRNLDDYF